MQVPAMRLLCLLAADSLSSDLRDDESDDEERMRAGSSGRHTLDLPQRSKILIKNIFEQAYHRR
jgi:hypothetical protein